MGMEFLQELEGRLARTSQLSGPGRLITDAAIMPFVRQFAAVDQLWFSDQPVPRLQAWLAEQHAKEMAIAAAEKQSLLEVLTHEVRQPFNNAQAALHDVMMTVQTNSRDYAAGQRLQSIIDQIVLTLSNAIVGASMLERKSQSLLVRTDILSVTELACSDVGFDWGKRIDLNSPNGRIFAEADPILLRLAIRNLLDNALKHSAPGKKVQVTINEDEANLAVIITVRNWSARPFAPTQSLFERGERGDQPVSEGKGLGLYIVQEVATLHGGRASFANYDDDGSISFSLKIAA
jgi:signal transduction histidine kinase